MLLRGKGDIFSEVMEKNIYDEFYKRLGLVIGWKAIDDLVVSDANILRPVKGAAFEYLFGLIFKDKFKVILGPGTGDSDIDKTLTSNNRKITMQIKTSAVSTIKEKIRFGVNLHKTHGLEKRPNNLYPIMWPCPKCGHEGESFPDYLIVLHPKSGILIVPKNNIPENKTYPGHYADPAYFEWNSEWLNRWDLLGFPEYRGKSLERRKIGVQKKLPKLAQMIKLTDEEIISLWLQPENFRMIDMNLKGNLREPALVEFFKKNGISLVHPTGPYPKYDKITKKGIKIQIKGPSKSFCKLEDNLLGTEVMGTHGKGAIRCYSENDFDYLGFVIDPSYLEDTLGLDKNTYHFCLIPIKSLPLHYKNKIWGTKNKIYPICKFEIKKDKLGVFLEPYVNYRVKIKFRGFGPWYIDKIPKDFSS